MPPFKRGPIHCAAVMTRSDGGQQGDTGEAASEPASKQDAKWDCSAQNRDRF